MGVMHVWPLILVDAMDVLLALIPPFESHTLMFENICVCYHLCILPFYNTVFKTSTVRFVFFCFCLFHYSYFNVAPHPRWH